MLANTRNTLFAKVSLLDLRSLIFCVAILLFGTLIVIDISMVESLADFGNPYHIIRRHFSWTSLGLLCAVIAFFIPLDIFKQYTRWIFLLSVCSLVLVFIPGLGVEINGARRWIYFSGISLQPAEFVKLSICLYFPYWLEKEVSFIPFLFQSLLVLFLILLQPDLGTSLVIMAISSIVFFAAGASLQGLLKLCASFFTLTTVLVLSSSYRRARLLTFLQPDRDPSGAGYHISQVLETIQSGGLTGYGIGQSNQKFLRVPELSTDSIFAIISEQLGFIGGASLLILFGVLIWLIFQRITQLTNTYAKLLSISIVVWLSSQVFLNIASMLAIIPMTGLPLPLVSYGGSSMVSLLVALGFYFNASTHIK